MTHNIAISFCLPVYNVANYIESCLYNIVNQNIMGGYEIVCLDDCSTDGSFELLNNIACRYKNVIVRRNIKNKGVSFTRNRLIEMARGRYIWFVDPDDMLYPNVVNLVLQSAIDSNADVLLGNYIRISEKEQPELPPITSLRLQKNENLNILPKDFNGTNMCAIWAGIFKRNFLSDNRLYFNEKMIAQEDTLFYYEVSLHTQNIFHFAETAYIYRQRESSIMHSHGAKRAFQYYQSMQEMYRVYKNYLISESPISKGLLIEKIEQMRQNLVLTLAGVYETRRVKTELKVLKQEGIYPYRKNFLSNSKKNIILNCLLKKEYGFWIIHFAAKLKMLISGL